MTGQRERARADTMARILQAARREVAAHGGGLSMRAVARESGIVSSAIYRYFPTREALLTAMIAESYGNLAQVLHGADGDGDAARWRALARALRGWAREFPQEFQLIYGTPIPGYVAPSETVQAAAAVAAPFVAAGARTPVEGFGGESLLAGMGAVAGDGADPSGFAAVLAELAALVGFVGLELAGHFVGTADPADPLYDALVERQVGTLGLGS